MSDRDETPDAGIAWGKMLLAQLRGDPDWERLTPPPPTPEELAKREAEERASAARHAEAERKREATRHARAVRALPMPLTAKALEALEAKRWDDTPAVRMVRMWMETAAEPHGRSVLVLIGQPGVGKTFAAAVAMLRVGGSASYAKIRDVCRLYRASWGDERAQYEAMIAAGLLVIDELGTERGSDAELAAVALQDMVDERQRPGKLTLILGNISKGQLVDGRYDERTLDRLRTIGAVRELHGDSMRRGTL